MPREEGEAWIPLSGFLTAVSVVVDWILVVAGLAGIALYAYVGGGDRHAVIRRFLRGFYAGVGLMVLNWLVSRIFGG